MSTEHTHKDRVLAWVRSKNPHTMELDFGCMIEDARGSKRVLCERYEHVKGDLYRSVARPNCLVQICEILGSDMGLQELLIAMKTLHPKPAYFGVHINHPFGCESFHEGNLVIHVQATFSPFSFNIPFDLTKNLHNQSPEFYESLLPLLQ